MTSLERIFHSVLKREGREIKCLTSNTTERVVFRKNSDKNLIMDRISIFTRITTALNEGDLIEYRNKIFLALNKETVENDTYYNFNLVQTNGFIEYIIGGVIKKIPIYSKEVQGIKLDSVGNNMILPDGSISIITEDNALSRLLEEKYSFVEYGKTWEITDIYFMNGLAYIKVKIGLVNPNVRYELRINNTISAYNIGDSFEMNTTCLKIDGEVETVLNDIVLTYNTGSEAIATVSNGSVTCIGAGNTAISVIWADKNITKTFNIQVEQTIVTEPKIEVFAVDGINNQIEFNKDKVFSVRVSPSR